GTLAVTMSCCDASCRARRRDRRRSLPPACLSTPTRPSSACARSLPDALPILSNREKLNEGLELMIDSPAVGWGVHVDRVTVDHQDRKRTRLNSSHVKISYAVFCLKKKNVVAVMHDCSRRERIRCGARREQSGG